MLKSLFNYLPKFFSIDNPFLFASFLFIIIFSRINVSYFNTDNTVKAPDIGFYAGEFVGHDLLFATTDQAYRLFDGLPMQLDVGYGYMFTILAAWFLQIVNFFGLCSFENPSSCNFLFYKAVVSISVLGLFSLAFILIKNRHKQSLALIFFSAFLLGVPGGMGLESGNLDIFLSMLYGYMLFFHQRSLQQKNKFFYPILLGCLSGCIFQTKLFLLPFAIIFYICSTKRIYFGISFLLTVSVITLLPGLYNVPINPLYTFQAAEYLRTAVDFSSGIVYGNNSTRAMAGGIVFAVPGLFTHELFRIFSITVLGLLIFLLVMVLPLFSFLPKVYRNILRKIKKSRLDYSFFLLLNAYTVSGVILWPEVSLSYRLYYVIPLVYLLFDKAHKPILNQIIGIALTALIIRSAFVWHSRVLHFFLLAFFYFFITAYLFVWLDSFIPKKTVAQNMQVK